MEQYLNEATTLSGQMLEEINREAEEIQARLNRGVLVTVKEIKEWRRNWVDRIVPIRQLAKKAKAEGQEDEGDAIKDVAVELEDHVKDLESQLKDDADELEEAQERGGVLTQQERIQRASKEGRKSYGLSCPNCGAALPNAKIEVCAYCGSILHDESGKISTGWIARQKEAESESASPDMVYQAARERIEALRQTYQAQLEAERQGLLAVLEAGKKHTQEFENALEDAGTRLDRIWDRIREVGQKAEDRLNEMEADELDDKISDFYDKVCEQLDELRRTVLSSVERKARLAWDRQADGRDTVVKCSHCGAELGIVNPSQPGEATCKHCGGLTKYNAHLSSLDVEINTMIDKQMDRQMPLEEQFQYWKGVCISEPTDENLKKYEDAARAMYDKQLFYMKDDEKRKVNVDRYVALAMKEVR